LFPAMVASPWNWNVSLTCRNRKKQAESQMLLWMERRMNLLQRLLLMARSPSLLRLRCFMFVEGDVDRAVSLLE
jgi:hypothetical protein